MIRIDPSVTVSGGMMMQEHQEDPALDESRTYLRAKQREHANTDLPIPSGQLITDVAIKRLEEMKQIVPTELPHIVRRGAFKYDRKQEGERIARARAIIHRVAPGPLEDPNYFAILAYQAASIEMAFADMTMHSKESDRSSKYLFGTVHAPHINAFAQKSTSGGYTIVVLYSGLIDFLYQAAKVIAHDH